MVWASPHAWADETSPGPSSTTAIATSNDDPQQPQDDERGYVALGVGYSPFEQLVFSAGLGHGRLFGVDGLHLHQQARLSSLSQTINLVLAGGPKLNQGPILWEVGGLYQERRLTLHSDLNERRYGGHMRVGVQTDRQWSMHLGVRLEQRTLHQADVLQGAEGGLEEYPAHPHQNLASLWFEVRYHTQPDDEHDPFMYRGWLIDNRVEQTVGVFGTDDRFLTARTRLGYGLTLPGQVKLLAEGQAGLLVSDRVTDVPFFDRFRLGGPYAFAGTFLTSAGPQQPTDPNDPTQTLALGGSGVVYGRLEMQLPVVSSIGLFAFGGIEGGGLRDRLGEANRVDWAASGYGGLRWLSPLGAMSMGWGTPLNVPEPYREPIFLFQLGGAF
ncbi:MAG: BamA/TamA family outer membrane protein [Myxococcota bacterium]